MIKKLTKSLKKYELKVYKLPANEKTKSLKIANNSPINNPIIKETDKSFRVIIAALSNLGKLLIINSKSINIPYYILLLTC